MLHRCKNGHECWREVPDYMASLWTCPLCAELLLPCADLALPFVAPPKGAKLVIGCPKAGCRHPGWWVDTNTVEYGEQTLVESWDAWCPVHGGYGQSGASGVAFDDELGPIGGLNDYTWATYHGYKDVKEWRRRVLHNG